MIKKVLLIILLFISYKAESQDSALTVADSLFKLANYTKAINAYAKVPTSYASWQIARAYNSIGNYDKAILQYESLLEKDTNLFLAKYELGILYYKTRSFQKAKDVFTTLIENDDQNPQYHYYLGLISKQEKGTSEESLLAFKKAYNIDNTHLKSINEIGKYYVLFKEVDSVILYVDKGLAFYPNSTELINLKALSLFNDRDYHEARPLFERLIELKQEKQYIYEKLGVCYVNTKDYEKAIEAYNKVLEFDDEDAEAYNALGHIFWKLKDYEKAIDLVEKSIEVQEVKFDKEYTTLAHIYMDQRDKKKALDYYNLAFEENPNNQFIYYRICFLADTYYKNPKDKLRYFENYIEKFGGRLKQFDEYIEKRISELKTEIHLSRE
ncbi:tetratricopeptide repeat protein [Flavobacteriaceae bacterium R38]|nr:tetratricopeptide repeat protein [Flavobacteriaceae bacterium R38]